MTPTVVHLVVLLLAGVLAGVVGSAGGITSLISYPALLLVGIPALPATVTNSVALVACWPGSALSSRPELRGQLPWLRSWIPVVAAGSTVGAALLLSTPPGLFARVVPFLVALAALALLFQPKLSDWQQGQVIPGNQFLLPFGLFSLSAYNGYFGAGAGVMILGLLLVLVNQQFAQANALKNMLVGAASVVAAVAFVFFGPVKWTAVAPLSIGLFIGSTIGPLLARRIPGNWLRVVVALTGLGLAVRLWLAPG
ncbi:MAG: sulfite exporter TauE/SafE family protein [Candidatus Dormiibacterota bacterium]